MADRGFDVEGVFQPLGVELNIPPVMRGRDQLDEKDMVETRKIASLRMGNWTYKELLLFDKPIPVSLACFADQAFLYVLYWLTSTLHLYNKLTDTDGLLPK